MPGDIKATLEGGTKLYVPVGSLSGGPPATHPVFFNPAARVNRDVSVAIAGATRPATYLDALAGTGARGVRVAKEASETTSVTLADFNRASLAVARKNVSVNGLRGRCQVVHAEANEFLFSRFGREEKFEAVDLDPFGTPAPYILGAMVACADGGVLSFTATDAAVLCAVYPSVTLRRYGALAVRSEFVHETALRTLVAFAARMGGVNDIGVRPIAAHSTLHYLRVFLKVGRKASSADDAMKELEFVTQCNGCGARHVTGAPLSSCPGCGSRTRSSGPVWTGAIADRRVVESATRFAGEAGLSSAEKLMRGLAALDRLPPYSYSLERACSKLRTPSVPAEGVSVALRSRGFDALLSPFDGLAIKTGASYPEFLDSVREASSAPAHADQVHLGA